MENNIPKFTFCITSKNNLRYLKHAVFYIKENSAIEHDILVFIDADNDGTEEWCINNNIKYIKNPNKELFGIGNAYNLLVKKATTDFVVIYHADMIMGKEFDINLYKHWKPKTVVSATRIEPPLHPSDPAKIVLDLGLWPEVDIYDGFKLNEFNIFVESNIKDSVTKGIFAPWLIHKDDFDNIGGHDPIMKSHSEDRDLFNRFLLNGYDLIQSWGSLVYHLTCRGGQFEHAKNTNDLNYKSNDWNKLAHTQTREFIRKWNSPPKYNEYQYPIISHKYDVGFIIKKCNEQFLELLEPWCSTAYVDCDYKNYIKKEQSNTSFNLEDRILGIDSYKYNNILIEFDTKLFTQQSFNVIQNLSDIITESGEIGEFELDCFKIIIKDLTSFEEKLIKV